MLKKLYLSCALSLIAMTANISAMAPDAVDTTITSPTTNTSGMAALSNQLKNISTQMNAIKRAWNTERIHLKLAEKASSSLYTAIKPRMERIISSEEFQNKMNTAVDGQFNAIVNNNTPFKDVKIENSLSDLFPNLTMNEYGRKLYTAMADKAYLLLLGQKLAAKVKEIAAAIRSGRAEVTGSQTA